MEYKINICDTVCNILNNSFNIDFGLLALPNHTEPLTGSMFKMTSFDLTYLFFFIEKEFDIEINENEISNYEFNTIESKVLPPSIVLALYPYVVVAPVDVLLLQKYICIKILLREIILHNLINFHHKVQVRQNHLYKEFRNWRIINNPL